MKRFAPLLAPILLACSSLLFAAPAVEHLRLSVIPTAVSSGADSSPTQRTTASSCVSTAVAIFGSATSKTGANMHSWSSVQV